MRNVVPKYHTRALAINYFVNIIIKIDYFIIVFICRIEKLKFFKTQIKIDKKTLLIYNSINNVLRVSII